MKILADGTPVPNTTMPDDVALTSKVIMYMFNYKHNFLLDAFNGSTAQHFQSKFDSYYYSLGNGERAFLYLWNDMSTSYRIELSNYINATFKG